MTRPGRRAPAPWSTSATPSRSASTRSAPRQGQDRGAERAFREIARLTGGAYAAFDSSAPGKLGSLLAAAAAYAAGGTLALEGQNTAADRDAARLLLSQIR